MKRCKKCVKVMLLSLFSVWIFSGSVHADMYRWMDDNGVMRMTNIKPDWWTDEMKYQLPEQIHSPAEDSSKESKKFYGDRESRVFHKPDCDLIRNPDNQLTIPKDSIMTFRSAEEAVSLGYRPCDKCNPTSKAEDN